MAQVRRMKISNGLYNFSGPTVKRGNGRGGKLNAQDKIVFIRRRAFRLTFATLYCEILSSVEGIIREKFVINSYSILSNFFILVVISK